MNELRRREKKFTVVKIKHSRIIRYVKNVFVKSVTSFPL